MILPNCLGIRLNYRTFFASFPGFTVDILNSYVTADSFHGSDSNTIWAYRYIYMTNEVYTYINTFMLYFRIILRPYYSNTNKT
jgi:hypothetical protein